MGTKNAAPALFVEGPAVGDRVMVVTTAGCDYWGHDGDPRLEGVRGTVTNMFDSAEPPHVFTVTFDEPFPQIGLGRLPRLVASTFSADEIQVVKRADRD